MASQKRSQRRDGKKSERYEQARTWLSEAMSSARINRESCPVNIQEIVDGMAQGTINTVRDVIDLVLSAMDDYDTGRTVSGKRGGQGTSFSDYDEDEGGKSVSYRRTTVRGPRSYAQTGGRHARREKGKTRGGK